MDLMSNHADFIATGAKVASYSTSAGLVAASVMDFMNNNIGFIGGVLGIATFLLNLHFNNKRIDLDQEFKQKEHKLRAESLMRRSDDE